MSYETIITDTPEPGIHLITLNRPDRMNAWTPKMMEELIDAFRLADDDDEVRAIIITGQGKAYCAGADLDPNGTLGKDTDKGKLHRDTAGQLTLTIYDLKKPVIAAINGAAVGVGATMTLPMDIRIASKNAKIGFVFDRRGMVAEGCSTWFLPRIVGISQASEWILTGRIMMAEEAKSGGLLSRVVEPEELMTTAFELAREVAHNTSPISTALSRQMMWKMLGADHPMEAHKIESKNLSYMFHSEDFLEGVMSFLEKRPPKFPGKPGKDLPEWWPWWEDRPFDIE